VCLTQGVAYNARMLDFIFRWEMVVAVVGILLTIGFGVLALDDFRFAKACFGLAAADLAGGIVMWGISTPLDSKLRVLVVALCFAVIGVLMVESWRYVDKKEKAKLPKPPTQVGEVPKDERPIQPSTHVEEKATPPVRPSVKDRLSSALVFRALATAIGNMPELKRVQLTWDSKPWNEEHYSDVRLTIENTFDFALQNLDLNIIATDGEEKSRVAGIGQLSDVNGLEFHPPKMPEMPPLALRGTDGKTYQLPTDTLFGNTWLPATKFRIFCSRLLPGEPLRLIIATVHDDGTKIPPNHLRITGVYETAPSEGSIRGRVDKIVKVVQ
jgi:hypothetical protein